MIGKEEKFWTSIIDGFSSYDKFDFNLSTYLGFRTRSWQRLERPSFQLFIDSFILVAIANNDSSDMVGLVEVCLGKLEDVIRSLLD